MAIYHINNKILDINNRVIIDGNNNSIKISQSELRILISFISMSTKVWNKDELLQQGWPNSIVVINSLTVAISNLRKVFKDANIIISHKGIGYSLNADTKISQINTQPSDQLNELAPPKIKTTKPLIINAIIFISILFFMFSLWFYYTWNYTYV
ncbi:winged helix-turn-helix domain-containing protein [Photobacterium kishitanii]|uniref:winged helix-turn-helix domain-containing protein n=1 Tax=Photobacterium kishitanii TaxID=318456 RepID=UPI00071AEE26|nr:winged helix-turn-helix domain-containing protein [Photobacterium kishitanii]